MQDASLAPPPAPTRLADYRAPEFLADTGDLTFDHGEDETRDAAHLPLRRNPDGATGGSPAPLSVSLANGSLAGAGPPPAGRPCADWVQPDRTPAYRLARPAGVLVAVEPRFPPPAGREVALAIWVRRGDEDECGHA